MNESGRRSLAGAVVTLSATKVRRYAALQHHVALLLGIDLGIIDREVEAAALAPGRRALDDELSDGGDVPKLEEVAGDEVLPVIFGDFFLQKRDTACRPAQAFVAANDADVVPHEAAELVPV